MPSGLILLAGGSNRRMNEAVADKVLFQIKGKAVIRYSLETFIESGVVNQVVIVYRDEEQRQGIEAAVKDLKEVEIEYCQGGDTRQTSALEGLKKLKGAVKYVYIHDGARPLIEKESIRELNEVVLKTGAAALGHRVKDTMVQETKGGVEVLDRDKLWAMETPQGFEYGLILEAYEAMDTKGMVATDESSAVRDLGHFVTIVENKWPNPKVTVAEDLEYVEYLLTKKERQDVAV